VPASESDRFWSMFQCLFTVNIGRWNPIKLDYRTRFPSKEKRKKK
jgi:hypothetical protein